MLGSKCIKLLYKYSQFNDNNSYINSYFLQFSRLLSKFYFFSYIRKCE